MKKVILFFLFMLLVVNSFSQSPMNFSYQAIIRDANNNLLKNQSVGMQISILQGSSTGSAVYVETQTVTSNSNGLITAEIGNGTAVSGTFSSVDWSAGPYFLKIETDPSGGTNYTISGVSQLLSVPYALYAKKAENGFSGNYNDLTNKPSGNNIGDIQYWNGSSWVLLPAGNSGQVLSISPGNVPVWRNDTTNFHSTSLAPTALIGSVSNLLMNSATLNGTVNANGYLTTTIFEYGTTKSYGNQITATESPVVGNSDSSVSANISLLANTKYHYRLHTYNAVGITYSIDSTFTTPGQVPSISSNQFSGVTTSSVSFYGNVNDNGYSTRVIFEYGTSTNYGDSVIPNQSIISGNNNTNLYGTANALTPGTDYHARIKAVNALGTSYSPDMEFTTLGSVPTLSALNCGNGTNSINLYTYVNPNYLSTIVTFEYGATSSYGLSSSQINVSGNNYSNYVNATISGLQIGSSYHFRTKAVNSLGTSYGNDTVFTTLGGKPIISTSYLYGPSSINETFYAYVNPNYLPTSVIIQYGTSLAYGDSISSAQNPGSGGGTVNLYNSLNQLTPATTYHMRVKAANSLGTSYGRDTTFTTLGGKPIISASSFYYTSGTYEEFYAYVNPNFLPTSVIIQYGTSLNYGDSISSAQSPGSGGGTVSLYNTITQLTPATTYHMRIKAVNALGTSYGKDTTFTTLGGIPSAVTTGVDEATATPITATLNGSVFSNYLPTTVSFEYGLTKSYGSTVIYASNPLAGNNYSANVSALATGLSAANTYHYRVKAVNSSGTTYGQDTTFTTGQAPSITSLVVNYGILAGTDSLSGVVNANYLPTVVTFEYGTSTSYGSSVGATQSPINGNVSSNVSSNISGLTAGTTYHFRIKAVNALGTKYSGDRQFIASNLAVGENYQGGLIAFLDSTGQHGYIVAPNDQSISSTWYNGYNVSTSTSDMSIGAGKKNTSTIIAIQGPGNYAAYICDTLTLNGKTDWFLPSVNEMELCSELFSNGKGNFQQDGYYWTSTEGNSNYAYFCYPYNTQFYPLTNSKASSAQVRAMRTF